MKMGVEPKSCNHDTLIIKL